MVPSDRRALAASSLSNNNNNNINCNQRPPTKETTEDQLANDSDQQQQQQAPSYLSSIINRSQLLLATLKKQQLSPTRLHERLTGGALRPDIMQHPHQQRDRSTSRGIEEEEQTTSAAGSGETGTGANAGAGVESKRRRRQAEEMAAHDWQTTSQSSADNSSSKAVQKAGSQSLARAPAIGGGSPRKPPLPPPPANRHVLQASLQTSSGGAIDHSLQKQLTSQQQPVLSSSSSSSSGATASTAITAAPSSSASASASASSSSNAPTRRHALQEQSFERDAALSLKTRELKHKRTSSIKSALRHASGHLGSLRAGGSGSSSSSTSAHGIKTMPYELFEPPITQRTYQRSRRRGAMSDPKRQMSADTIGLRQLTDEYLQNAGVKPISSSGQCSLVALTQPLTGATCATATTSIPGANQTTIDKPRLPGVANLGAMHHAFSSIEAQLYGSNRTASAHQQTEESSCESSQDSLSTVAVHPGPLPWQSDVEIQCKLLRDPEMESGEEPYETTGDILNTIAGPFRLPAGTASQPVSMHHQQSDGLSATLKRGLNAIATTTGGQHHLSPGGQTGAATLNVVVGSLKKSLSNTLDISRASALQAAHHLHSEDSLPAYSSLQNEPDSPTGNQENEGGSSEQQQQHHSLSANVMAGGLDTADSGGLIGQLASKLTRQSSRKFTVSKKGLHRALSFDCRNGYKRLEQQQQQQQRAQQENKSQHGRHLLATSSKLRAHNKSSMALSVDRSGPRPYLAQSASQVDFQLPLLPYHKMQEAIVAQRRLDQPPNIASSQAATHPEGGPTAEANPSQTKKMPDADELICGGNGQHSVGVEPVEPVRVNVAASSSQDAKEEFSKDRSRSASRGSTRRKTSPPPKLVLDIPVISTPTTQQKPGERKRGPSQEEVDDGGEEVCAVAERDQTTSHPKTIVCLPSPNIAIDPSFNVLPNSNSFCLDPSGNNHFAGRNQLTATDVFSNSNNFVKRPSTLVTCETITQALSNSTQNGKQVPVVLRNRRQAIVPPKLVTDPNQSDSDSGPQVGHLVDVDADDDDCDGEGQGKGRNKLDCNQLDRDDDDDDDEATVRALRRKRSGGGASSNQQTRANHFASTTTTVCNDLRPGGKLTGRRLSGSATALPTFCIEPDESELDKRPDSQMTNVDSINSTGSSTNLSQKAAGKRDFHVTSTGGLTVSFGASPARRRSSIAVIPQMQICPGDLLVYSKQMLDRMTQSDDSDVPQFLTTDDRCREKNIWSSFKLFENREVRARNEILCSMEDVLASLQPTTFVDEQLSHYKGMPWEQFLNETESRRSASSEVLSVWADKPTDNNNNCKSNENSNKSETNNVEESNDDFPEVRVEISCGDSIKTDANRPSVAGKSVSALHSPVDKPHAPSVDGSKSGSAATQSGTTQQKTSREPAVRSISSRFREKPKLKRGQTVDSVFRIPLIPSSPLKHAQQHQQTPTAHLEDHDLSITMEDDERSSPSSSLAGESPVATSPMRSRSKAISNNSSIRSRARSSSNQQVNTVTDQNGNNSLETSSTFQLNQQQNPDSSFETDDVMDLILDQKRASGGPIRKTPHQMTRQSSLSTLSSTFTRNEQRRQRALWDLFQSECNFFFELLMTLKNVFMEPLKKIQVEGFAMFADPDVLFGNLDELCCGVYEFCKEFLCIITKTLKTRPEELNAAEILIKLFKNNPKIDHLRTVYHRYTLNYINALNYLETLRRQVEFVEFERWSCRDVRCRKLQLTDLLVSPVQHAMRIPLILKDIRAHTENDWERDEITAILAVEESSLRELDDKMRWLRNFERLLEIQKNISWPNTLEMDPKLFIPDFLKDLLSKQPCEKLIVSPRRQIVYEGTLINYDLGIAKPCDMHVILFDDMLLLTRRKKTLTKKASTVCKTNSTGPLVRDDGSFKYVVYKTPLSLDRFYVHDVQPDKAEVMGIRSMFILIVMNRFQQITTVHSFSAPDDELKETWLFKLKKTMERWKRNLANNTAEQEQANQLPAFEIPNIVTQEPSSQQQQQQVAAKSLNDTATPRKGASSQPTSKRNSCELSTISNKSPSNEPGEGGEFYPSSGITRTMSDGTNQHQLHQQVQQPIELVVTGVQSTSSASSSRENVTSPA